jgi:hypothetical protein
VADPTDPSKREGLPLKQVTQTRPTVPADDAAHLQGDRARFEHEWESRSKELERTEQATYTRQEAESASMEKQVQAAADAERQQAEHPPDLTADKVRWTPHPVSSGEYQTMGWMVLAAGLIGGAVSHGNWLGVGNVMNGMMQGIITGDQERYKRERENYETQFKEALEHDRAVQKQFDDILRARNLTLNEMIRRSGQLAAQHGREDIRLAAQQRSVDRLQEQVRATDTSLANIQRGHESFTWGLPNINSTNKGRQIGELNQFGEWLVANNYVFGGKVFNLTHSQFASKEMFDIANIIGQYFYEAKIDPASITEAQLSVQAQAAVLKTVENRRAGVVKLTRSIQQIEARVTSLVGKINHQYGASAANNSWQWISQHFGHDPDVIELRTLMWTVATQYTEATTMPNSNAQLHATVQADMVERFNSGYNLQQILGLFRGVNKDIQVVEAALTKSVQEAQDAVGHSKFTIPLSLFTKQDPESLAILAKVKAKIPDGVYAEDPPAGYAGGAAPAASSSSVSSSQSAPPSSVEQEALDLLPK